MWFQTSALHPDDGLPPWLNSFPGRCSSRSAKLPGQSAWISTCVYCCGPTSAASCGDGLPRCDHRQGKAYQGWCVFPGSLAGGQQQQLAIARALLGKPRLLLLEEPTEGIQPSVVLDIQRAVGRIIRETGISVLLVDHHASFVPQSDWYYAMQKGGIVASGATADLSPEMIQRFLSV